MAPDFQKFMTEATRLTRAGDLEAATAMIQKALDRHTFAAGRADDGNVIDVDVREVVADDDVPACVALLGFDGNPPPFVDLPPLAERFIGGRFGEGRAARDYKLFIPPTVPGAEPGPLVVMLHGCTQDPDDFAAGTRMNRLAAEHGIHVLYPAQSRQANPQACWNWFKANHQQHGRGEPATLADMTRRIVADHPIDSSRVYVAGLSAGGAMAAILAQAYPELFAAVGIHSGLPAGAAKDLPGALAAMKGQGGRGEPLRVPTIVFHGDADATVHARNGAQVFAAAPGGDDTLLSDTLRPDGSRRAVTRHRRTDDNSRVVAEHWVVHGAGHAWFGGDPAGSYTDPDAPDASAQMLRFFLAHRLGKG